MESLRNDRQYHIGRVSEIHGEYEFCTPILLAVGPGQDPLQVADHVARSWRDEPDELDAGRAGGADYLVCNGEIRVQVSVRSGPLPIDRAAVLAEVLTVHDAPSGSQQPTRAARTPGV